MGSMEGLKLRKPLNLKPLATAAKKDLQDIDEPLSPVARMFLKPDSNLYIISMLGLRKKVCPDVVKADLLASPLLKHPRFSRLLVPDAKKGGGEMKWVQSEVDIDKHVIVPDLNQEEIERVSSADKFIEDYISNLSKTNIDMSKPLWDFHILNIKNSVKTEDEAEGVAILRVHHALGDGMSLMSLLFASARKTSDHTALPTIPAAKKKVGKKHSSKLKGFVYALRVIWNTLVDVFIFLATYLKFMKDTQTPLKNPPNWGGVGCSFHRRIVHKTVSLDDIKLVKNAMNNTINDVIMGVIQAASSRYLNRKSGELAKKNGSKNLGEETNYLAKNIRLRCLVFTNLRTAPGIHALDAMMEKGTKAKWGNQIGYVLIPLTIALRKNPLDYVRTAKVVMDRKKASFEAICTSFISTLVLKLGPKVGSFPTETTIWFSNVAGPQEEITLFGSPIAYLGATCYGQPIGILIHVISYTNKIRFILSVDEDTIPDPHQLCDDLEESLKQIKEAAIAEKGTINTN